MQWLREHRYTIALIGAAVFVVVGGVLTRNNTGTVSELGDIKNVAVEYPYYSPQANTEPGPATGTQSIPRNATPGAGSSTPPLADFFSRAPTPENPAIESAPVATTKAPAKEPATAQDAPFNNPYALFFRALSNILSPADTRTPEQKALFDYGNKVGSLIRNFENTHGNVTQVLKTFFDSRIDPSKAAGIPEIANAYAQLTSAIPLTPGATPASATVGVQSIANEYTQLGLAIGNVPGVPPQAESLNAKLAKGYRDAAQGLSKLSQTENNATLLEAINAYNANADEFIKNYVALVDLFSMYGVRFSASDPGAIFSFSI